MRSDGKFESRITFDCSSVLAKKIASLGLIISLIGDLR